MYGKNFAFSPLHASTIRGNIVYPSQQFAKKEKKKGKQTRNKQIKNPKNTWL